jgi:hypothetical protein
MSTRRVTRFVVVLVLRPKAFILVVSDGLLRQGLKDLRLIVRAETSKPPAHLVVHLVLDLRAASVVVRVVEGFEDLGTRTRL